MKYYRLLFMLFGILMISCQKQMNGNQSRRFENDKSVDLSKVISVYERFGVDSEVGYELAKIMFDYELINQDIVLSMNSDFALKLPEYSNSEHPFLKDAEVFYNSCVLTFDVWSNYEAWVMELYKDNDVKAAIKSLDVSCINNLKIRQDAQIYKDSVLLLMDKPMDEWNENESVKDCMHSFGNKIESNAYHISIDNSAFLDSLKNVESELRSMTMATFEQCQKVEDDKQLETMLHTINNCSTFDEQCSLLLNWADSECKVNHDEWIVAVADQLMKSGKYNPCLYNVWLIWRCLVQDMYFGMSHDSSIPNDYYNRKRKICYQANLKHIEKYPDDVQGVISAIAISGRSNLNRFGRYQFGNNAMLEQQELLPQRFE